MTEHSPQFMDGYGDRPDRAETAYDDLTTEDYYEAILNSYNDGIIDYDDFLRLTAELGD